MNKLTKEIYEQQAEQCDGLCDITEEMVTNNPELMRCVTCPFCKETVDAILTPESIRCPKCGVKVNR